jgi:PRC-barrel domain protein
MTELYGDDVLARPVRLHGIDLGRPVDLLLDRDGLRVVGADVLCGDDEHRFLPLPTASIDEALTIYSPLVLLEEDELDFYRSRAFALSSLRGQAVTRKGKVVGTLGDVVFAPGGRLLAILLETGERIEFDGTLGFAPRRRSAA